MSLTVNRARVKKYEDGQLSRGLKKISLWIPANELAVKSISGSAKRLRKKYKVQLPRD